MLPIIFYYLLLPFLGAALIVRLIRKYGGSLVPEDVSRHFQRHPIEKGSYRALRRGGAEPESLGDFETHDDAVDAAFKGRHEARAQGRRGSFVVLDHKGQVLDQFDS